MVQSAMFPHISKGIDSIHSLFTKVYRQMYTIVKYNVVFEQNAVSIIVEVKVTFFIFSSLHQINIQPYSSQELQFLDSPPSPINKISSHPPCLTMFNN